MEDNKNYEYPIDYTWSQTEMVEVINFYNLVESAYEEGVNTADFLKGFNQFRKIVPMKMEQNRLGREFEMASGYSIYKAVKIANNSKNTKFKA